MNHKLIPFLLLPFVLAACGDSEPQAVAKAEAPTGQEAGSSEAGHEERGHEEGGHEESEGGVALSPEQLKAAGIVVAEVGPARIRETLPLYGVIAPNAVRLREVAARFSGVIRSVHKNIGDPVREGETLATVESNESLQTYPVTAPLSGVVTARSANPGEQTGDKSLFTVADLSTVWVELSLFPRDVAKVQTGQSVRVKSPDTGQSADGKVIYVAPFGQAANQTLTARVLLDNAQRRWAPGLYVKADVVTSETQVALAIRKTAVQMLHDAPAVFVKTEKGFEPRKVQLGRGDAESVEVLSGLVAGETYAAANSYVLKAEAMKSEASEE